MKEETAPSSTGKKRQAPDDESVEHHDSRPLKAMKTMEEHLRPVKTIKREEESSRPAKTVKKEEEALRPATVKKEEEPAQALKSVAVPRVRCRAVHDESFCCTCVCWLRVEACCPGVNAMIHNSSTVLLRLCRSSHPASGRSSRRNRARTAVQPQLPSQPPAPVFRSRCVRPSWTWRQERKPPRQRKPKPRAAVQHSPGQVFPVRACCVKVLLSPQVSARASSLPRDPCIVVPTMSA